MLIGLLNQWGTLAQHITTSVQNQLMKWTQPLKESWVGGLVNDMTKDKSELIAENALFRQQVIIVRRQVKRPSLQTHDRLLLVLLASKVRAWRQVLLLVKPETVLA